MTADELRKYDKETLVKFISELMLSDYAKGDLDRIQSRLEFDKLMEKSEQIMNEMRKCDGLKDFQKWNDLYKRNEKLQKKINIHLGI